MAILKASRSPQTQQTFAPLPPGRLLSDYPMFTAIGHAPALDSTHLQQALARIDGFDLVGLTEQLGDFAHKLEQLTGISGQIEQVNVAPESPSVPDSLLQQIRQDNALDMQLYDHVSKQW